MESFKESEYNEICYKLNDACDGKIQINAEDAENILNLISKLLTMNVETQREKIAQNYYQLVSETSIIESLGQDNADELLVQYLKSNYDTKKAYDEYENVLSAHDLDQMGNTAPTAFSNEPIVEQRESKSKLEVLVESNELKKVLQDFRNWDFTVFSLLPHTPYPLAVVVETALGQLNEFIYDLDLNEVKLRKFLIAIQQKYKDLPYHNHIHGADVVQTMFFICSEGGLIDSLYVNSLGVLAMIIGAAIHDVGHPGLTGKFLVANSDPLAIQYNDSSPLENMHLALAFQIWGNTANNFTESIPWLLYKDLRKMIIDMVLATDNDMHFTLLGKVSDLISSGELNNVLQSQAAAMSTLAPNVNSSRTSSMPSPVPMNRSRLMSVASLSNETNNTPTNTNQHHSNSFLNLKKLNSFTSLSNPPSNFINNRHSQEKTNLRKLSVNSLTMSTGSTTPHGLTSTTGLTGGSGTSELNRSMSLVTERTPSPESTPRNRVGRVSSIVLNNPTTGESSTYLPMKAQQVMVLQAALHAADISGPSKPWDIHMRWTSLVMDEFYKQGDKERELNVPITFAFDRYNPVPMPKFQVGFIKAIVSPLYKTLTKINGITLVDAIEHLENNTKKWESKII